MTYFKCAYRTAILWDYMIFVPCAAGVLEKVVARILRSIHGR